MLAPHHLACDVYGCDPQILADPDEIRLFIEKAMDELHLKARGPPLIEKFPDTSDGPGGITACQIIETSLLGLHTYPETGVAYVDVFSCQVFNHVRAVSLIKRFFRGKRVKFSLVDRSPPKPPAIAECEEADDGEDSSE